ncbi:hypothetical protein ELH93_29105 (plasmid) [Rhizobium leguminosarum]|uniref:hypothetical protein n=1 Tax=Rhizobium leguminosarum TaxID=384 RepID=UPI0010317BBA|nr:hypothetical protein [Rhizobium leguminosarum]TAY27784.1 hypothetical protein ELH93_29105 [Rhizobium leguminosarum]
MPDLSNLPDDDVAALLLYIKEFMANYQEDWDKLDDQADTREIGIELMNNVIAAAGALDIDDFKQWEIPEWSEAYTVINDFKLFVKRYVIQTEIRNARSTKLNSVELDTASRERIHMLIAKIRKVIGGADLEERKRNSLYTKLNTFAADVDRSRTPFNNAMAFIIDAANTARKVGESLNPLTDFINGINELLGKAKEKEGDLKLPPPPERKRIEGPRRRVETPDMDDVPF